jgi:hypothetical protein
MYHTFNIMLEKSGYKLKYGRVKMDEDLLIILLSVLGSLLAVSLIAIVLLLMAKSKKKTQNFINDKKPAAEKNDYNTAASRVSYNLDQKEEDVKTEFLGRARRDSTLPDKSQNAVQRQAKSRVEIEEVPELYKNIMQAKTNIEVTEADVNPIYNETEFVHNKLESVKYILAFVNEGKTTTYEMNDKEIIIGRDPQIADLIISFDIRISRKHARLFMHEGQIFVEDLQSKNGTFINNMRIDSVCGIEGGRFKVGDTEITIHRG